MKKELWDLYYKCRGIAEKAHAGQVDKAGEPYADHPNRVANAVFAATCDMDYTYDEEFEAAMKCRCVALLHDVLEDTDTTVGDLRAAGVPDDVVEGVESVTRRDGESYGDFVKRAAANTFGRRVKYYDLLDNLDLTRLGKIGPDDLPRINKYLKWERWLRDNYRDI